MNVGVEAAGGENLALARDHFRAGTDDDCHTGLDVGIAGFTYRMDVAALEADVSFHNAPVIEDQHVGDDGVDRTLTVGDLALTHTVADHLAAAELHLFAVGGEIHLDLDDDIGVGQPHTVARRGAEHIGINRAAYGCRHVTPQKFRPSTFLIFKLSISISSRHRTLMATMSAPSRGCLPFAYDCTPQFEQNR